MSPKQTCDAKIAHTTISYDPYQTRATHTQQKTSAQSSRPAHPTFPRRANNMNNHQTLTPAPREHDSAPPPLPHDPKHNATHIDLRTTWKRTALPAPRNILQAPNATQRRTVIRRSPNTSRTGPSVREHHAKLPRIMASARPSSLTPPRPAQSQHSATQQANTRHRPNQTHLCFHHACATTLSTHNMEAHSLAGAAQHPTRTQRDTTSNRHQTFPEHLPHWPIRPRAPRETTPHHGLRAP